MQKLKSCYKGRYETFCNPPCNTQKFSEASNTKNSGTSLSDYSPRVNTKNLVISFSFFVGFAFTKTFQHSESFLNTEGPIMSILSTTGGSDLAVFGFFSNKTVAVSVFHTNKTKNCSWYGLATQYMRIPGILRRKTRNSFHFFGKKSNYFLFNRFSTVMNFIK